MRRKRVVLCLVLSFVLTATLIPEVSFGTASSASGQITGFAPLENDSYYYEGDPEEEDITSKLPDTMNVYLDGSDSVTAIPVRWEAVEDFDKSDFYFYSMKPVWGDSYSLSPDLSAVLDVPWITVYKQEPLVDEVEPIMTEEELDPIYVDKEKTREENDQVSGGSTEETAPATEEQVEETDTDDDTAGRFLELFAEESYAASSTNTDKVYRYLTTTMGLNKAAACGVMTNINAESGMSPNNLENTYNSRFGLSDAEYTKRVDAGKGKYKTKFGDSRNFKTDYCGYGLCQWTSLSRRKNLLSKALNRGTSVSDINMQLEFLREELSGSYSSVWSTLKNVPNNAQGAYMAAFVFCMCFEVPANTLNTSASRGKTCISKGGYWAKYSGSSASTSGTSFLSACGFSYPKTLKSGKGLTVKGYIVSNYKITRVSVAIRDANNVKKYKSGANPYSTVYSLYNFDSKLLFSKLGNGTYKYIIYAKDKSGKTIKAIRTFTVSSGGSTSTASGFCNTYDSGSSSSSSSTTTATAGTSPTEASETTATTTTAAKASTMDIYSFNYPTSLKKGRAFSIKGKIKSNYPMRKVTVKVVTTSDKTKLSASKSLTGTSKTYDIKKLDAKIKFGKLARGTYYYKVIGKDTQTSRTLLNKKFKVK